MSISTQSIPLFIEAIKAEITANADEVTALDQAIGDGDHVTNLKRGLEALEKQTSELSEMDWSAALMKIGMTLMSTMGGASGSLYGSLFVAMGKEAQKTEMDAAGFAEIFDAGVTAVKTRGKADLGEKTMLDTLIPASRALNEKADIAASDLLEAVKKAAYEGMLSTEDMLATKGRASFLGERARGHIDAGARTSQLMICAIADVIEKN
ncbi:dihydroxyacetone kinase subunit DhaL [Methylophaga sp. OBS1]|uniref:dihydroxyacetone kinase subunit DhaL n=1 Tax=Methylophaga sp. OBS1 TaxID=2991933 RepID=UPI002252EBAE|nr:dihydroxyacetone kinase subunit DhaL [Methylophaga sp. OBS1]MCX4193562.1 dihydroxyacetone kinase subunit DhaL [Methylophaga sp. OBS1]